MPWAISCQDLHKTCTGKPPVEAVRGIDLNVERGECFGVLGPNGAGKTTTIEVLEGLLRPTRGEVQVLERRWDHQADEIRQRIGISLQETRFPDKLSVIETLRLFRSFYASGIDPQQAMTRVSLQEKAQAWTKNLSGGQKQRLAVAVAIVGDPQLLASWTNRQRGSIPVLVAICGISLATSAAKGERCCSPRITWKKPNDSATAWRLWTTAK